jgi:hypothetical protein
MLDRRRETAADEPWPRRAKLTLRLLPRFTAYFEITGDSRQKGYRMYRSVATKLERCYQLMETENPRLLNVWIAHWQDIVDSAAPLSRNTPRWRG